MNHGLLLELIFNVNYNRLNHHNNNHCSLYNAIHHNNHLSSNASTYNHHIHHGANPVDTTGPQQEGAALVVGPAQKISSVVSSQP